MEEGGKETHLGQHHCSRPWSRSCGLTARHAVVGWGIKGYVGCRDDLVASVWRLEVSEPWSCRVGCEASAAALDGGSSSGLSGRSDRVEGGRTGSLGACVETGVQLNKNAKTKSRQ